MLIKDLSITHLNLVSNYGKWESYAMSNPQGYFDVSHKLVFNKEFQN